jgi:hypothetical protein
MMGHAGMMGQAQGVGALVSKVAPQMKMMQQRMDMMQRMVEQMIQQQQLVMKSPGDLPYLLALSGYA